MKSLIIKRSVVIDRHKTSVSLEESFWKDLKEIAHAQHMTLSKVIEDIDKARQGNLSSQYACLSSIMSAGTGIRGNILALGTRRNPNLWMK